jgi:hypothetical protein
MTDIDLLDLFSLFLMERMAATTLLQRTHFRTPSSARPMTFWPPWLQRPYSSARSVLVGPPYIFPGGSTQRTAWWCLALAFAACGLSIPIPFLDLLLNGALEVLAGNHRWPSDVKDVAQTSLDEGLQRVVVCLCGAPCLRAVEQDRLHMFLIKMLCYVNAL